MFDYNIDDGELTHNGEFIGTGYSGHAEGRNNRTMVAVHEIGPICPGVYKIIKPAFHHPKEGPCVMKLVPQPGTNTFGRDGFHIHGNNASNDASKGCIILGPTLREYIDSSPDEYITVH